MPIHVIPVGDVAAAVPHYGQAKKLARQVIADGLRTKVIYRGEVTFRVEHYPESDVTKVFIEADRVRHGYQFYTTTTTPIWTAKLAPWSSAAPVGSSVYVPTPALPTTEKPTPLITPQPWHSCVQIPPVVAGSPIWPYTPLPGTFAEVNALMTLTLFPVQQAWQVNGLPESVYYATSQTGPLGRRIESRLLNAWTSTGGTVYGVGMGLPFRYANVGDIAYDVAPGLIPKGGTVRQQMPDGDWPQRACLQVAAGRTFIILSTAEGAFHCWPLLPASLLDASMAVDSPYADQSYKSNVPASYARKVQPDYPNWAYVPTDEERHHFTERRADPRYKWSFNSTGTKAISIMAERTAFTGTWSKVRYQYAADRYEPTQWPASGVPRDERLSSSVRIDHAGFFPLELTTPITGISEDRIGVVELQFDVRVTGPKLEDFTFDVTLGGETHSPDECDALERGMVLEAAYALPMDWSQIATVGDLSPPTSMMTATPGVVAPLQADDLLTAWMTLYTHPRQSVMDKGYDGAVTPLIPSKSKVDFYHGSISDAIRLFGLPLSQAHGAGFTTDPTTDADGNVTMPPLAHPFVQCRDMTWAERYPYALTAASADGNRYEYDATLTHLDLSSLSFYYTARIVRWRRSTTALTGKPVTYAETYYPWYASTGEICCPFVFGRRVEVQYRGATAYGSFRDWLIGWMEKAPAQWLADDDGVLPQAQRMPLRGVVPTLPSEFSTSYAFLHIQTPIPPVPFSRINTTWAALAYSEYWPLLALIHHAQHGTAPWWFTGACYPLITQVLRHSMAEVADPGLFNRAVLPGFDGLKDGVENVSPAMRALDTVTETTISAFLAFINDFFTTAQQQRWWIDYPSEGDPGVQHSETSLVYDPALPQYDANPFSVANAGVLGTGWVAKAAAMVWEGIKVAQRIQAEVGPLYNSAGHEILYLWRTACRGNDREPVTGLSYSDYRLQGDFARLVLPSGSEDGGARDDDYIPDYPWGLHCYHLHWNRHFTPPIRAQHAAIQVTPDGHYSYSWRNHFSLTGEYPVMEVMYQFKDSVGADHNVLPTQVYPYMLGTGTPLPTLSDSDVDWGLVDRVGWHWGKVVSDHLSLYNVAYNPNRGTPGAKATLSSGERFTDFYAEESFKPLLRFITPTSTVVGPEPSFSSRDQADGFFEPLGKFFLPVTDGVPNHAAVVGQADPEHSQETYLRLSPLFF